MLLFAALAAPLALLYLVNWQSQWTVERASIPVNTLDLDLNRHGFMPDVRYPDGPPRVVVAGPGAEALVFDLDRGASSWQSTAGLDLARSVYLESLRSPASASVEMSFDGVRVPHPVYDFLGRGRWILRDGYFGRVHLNVGHPASAALGRVLVNFPYQPERESLVHWTPDGRYLVFRADQYSSDRRIFMLGPIPR